MNRCVSALDGEKNTWHANDTASFWLRFRLTSHPFKSWEASIRTIVDLMYLSDSCVRKIIVKFHTLLATVHVVRPRSDKRPVNFMVNTVSEIETTLSCADYRTWTTWPTICLQLGFSGRTPPVDILAIPTDQYDLISYHVTFCRMNLYVDDCTEFHCFDCTGTRFQCMYRYQSLCLWKEQSELNIHLRE